MSKYEWDGLGPREQSIADGRFASEVNDFDTDIVALAGPAQVKAALTELVAAALNGGGRLFNVKNYGAVGDGVTNDTAAIQAALTAATAVGGTVVFPPATYACLSLAIANATAGVTLFGYGARLLKLGGAAGTHVLDVTGTLGTSTLLTGNAAEGDASVALTSATAFPAATYVLLRDDTYAYTTQGRNQELNQVLSLASLTATLERRTIRSYATASAATALALTPSVNVLVCGLTFAVPTGVDNGGCVQCDLVYGATFRDCTFIGMNDDPGLYVTRSYNVWAEDCEWRDAQNITNSGGYGYGAAFYESAHHCGVRGGSSTNIRENLMSDGVRYITFEGMTCSNSYDASINTHGSGVRFATIRGCRITGSRALGISVGQSAPNAADRDVDVIDCDVEAAGTTGISVASSSGKENTNIRVMNNRVRLPSNVTASQYGISVGRTVGFQVSGNVVSGGSVNPAAAYLVAQAQDGLVQNNRATDMQSGYGFLVTDGTDITVKNNFCDNISSNNYRSTGTNVNVKFLNNYADDTSATIQAGDTFVDNDLGDTTIGMSADIGNNATTFTWGASFPTILYNTAITTDRAVTLSTTNATKGARATVIRTANATGAFNVNVGTGPLAALGIGEWCTVEFSGSAWTLEARGLLAQAAPIASPTFTGTPTLPTGTIGTTQAANNNSTALATTAYADRTPGNATSTPSSPTGTTATSPAVMMGLNGAITMAKATRAVFCIMGQMSNDTINDGVTVHLRTGTGTAPTNGAALAGSQRGAGQTKTSLVAADRSGFCIIAYVSGLAVGTTYWIDAGLQAVTGGTATITGVTITAWECP